MKLKELVEQRRKEIADSRAILDKAETEGRSMTDEEQVNYDKHFADADGLDKRIQTQQKQEDAEKRSYGTGADPEPAGDPTEPTEPEAIDLELRSGPNGEKRRLQTQVVRGVSEYREQFSRYLTGRATAAELRALQADSDEAGGFTVVPEQFAAGLIQAVDDLLFIRSLATVHTVTNAQSLGAVSLDADPADADWTTEVLTGSEDSTMDFGKRELNPHPLAKLVKVSRKLIRVSAQNIVNLVTERMAYKHALPQEKAFLTGSGAGQPLGLFTASASGISTARDVSTDNTTTAMTVDGLLETKFSLKAQYWLASRWLFHRDGVKQIAKFKDGEGQYLWRESVRAGEPDMLLGRPVLMSEHVPNTFTTGLYVGLLGDFSFYWIADALSMELQRLDELYAATNQVGFIGRVETDGQPVLEEAFARVTLA